MDGEATAADFREHTGATLESFSTLDRVNEDGEYTHGAISDGERCSASPPTGSCSAFPVQAVINNDLNQFTEIPRKMGQAAERTVADLVHGLLTSTANLKDGKPLFHADRKNLLTAAAISAASFGKAVTAMGTQKDSAGKTLALRPSFLIIPVALQMEAYQLLNATVIGTQAEPNRPNPVDELLHAGHRTAPRRHGRAARGSSPGCAARSFPWRGSAATRPLAWNSGRAGPSTARNSR